MAKSGYRQNNGLSGLGKVAAAIFLTLSALIVTPLAVPAQITAGSDMDPTDAPTPVIMSTANLGTVVEKLQPQLVFSKIIDYNQDGQPVKRYLYKVANASALPEGIFAPAPYLKPLSENADSCRTWVYMLDQNGNPLSTFATMKDKSGLDELWFASQPSIALPKKIYVDIWDRKLDKHYRSKMVIVTPPSK